MAPGGARRRKPRPLVAPPMRSMKRARRVTSAFHRLTQQQEEAAAQGDAAARAAAAAELAALGGRAAYQEASQLTTGRHRTAKWVFAQLTRLGRRPPKGAPALRVLEVGAVNLQLSAVPWLAVRAIDLRPSCAGIEQADFFDLAPAQEYQVVVCAMVLNCVPTPARRGAMLAGLRAHLAPGGLAFVMLPRRCLEASPYTTTERFTGALAAVGLQVVASKSSPKVAFFCAEAVGPPPQACLAQAHFPDPPPVIARGKALTNEFAVAFAA